MTRTLLAAACVLLGLGAVALAQDPAAIDAGEQLYDEHSRPATARSSEAPARCPTCGSCAPMPAALRSNGHERQGQMPPWQGVLSKEGLDQLWAYVRSRAR